MEPGAGEPQEHQKEDPPLDPTFDFSLIQNSLLQFNIALSEMFDYAYTPATAAELESDGELLDIGGNDVAMAQVFEMYSNLSYPTYTPDPSLTNKYPVTKTNILMLQGDTDPQTPYQWAMHAIAQYPGVNQQLVTIPLAVHGSAFPHTSPVDGAAGDSPTPTCGMEMLASFFSSGGTSVDQSCLGRLLAPDFAGALNATRMFSKLSWGTPDLWGSE